METSSQGGRAVVADGGTEGWFRRSANFLVAVRAEMHKVSWPSRDELTKATRMILIMAVALGVLIGWMVLLLQMILVDGVARLAQ
jgi:preprotein translocase SecE subunit